MAEKAEEHSTNYTRWASSTENVQIGVKEGGKRNACYMMSWKRWLVIVVLAAVVSLILGFVIGYLTRRAHHLSDLQALKSSLAPPRTTAASPEPEYQQYTDESYEELAKLINTSSLIQYVKAYASSGTTYHAGSTAINASAHELSYDYCSRMGLRLRAVTFSKVLLSRPGAVNSTTYKVTGPGGKSYENMVNDSSPDTMKPFVAYTASGNASGPPVYVAFGEKGDYDVSVNYTGAICYIRYGKLNPYNLIVNAESRGCVGVVLYPDPDEFPDIKRTDRIISNAKRVAGDPLTPGFASFSKNSYRLKIEDIAGSYLPPDIPVVTASQEMVSSALGSLLTSSVVTADSNSGSLLTGTLGRTPSNDTIVSLSVNNALPHETTSRSICAYRGDIDADKMVMVGTHHDEAGSGNIDPATGQAVMREMLRLIASYPNIYKPRRSIIFVTTDASYLDITSQEFIDENLREYGERVVAYVALTSTLSKGSNLHVKSSAPLTNFAKSVMSNFPEVQARHRGVEGFHYYRRYLANLAAPVVEMSFSDKEQTTAVDSLPVCCESATPNTTSERVNLMARIHLQAIMKLAGEPILPYDITEIRNMYKAGVGMVEKHKDVLDANLLLDLKMVEKNVGMMLTRLHMLISSVKGKKIKDVSLRRLNDALTGLTRACILPEGVPMVDPQDVTKVIRNLNNRNTLIGSISTNDHELVIFPGLQELFSVESPSDEIKRGISKHITEIMTSMGNVIDYCKRAIMDSKVFVPIS